MKNRKFQSAAILSILGAFALVFAIVIAMTAKNTADLKTILQSSVKAQLISTSIAARDMLDVDRFAAYNSLADVEEDKEAYAQVLSRLRSLQAEVGAEYIYALKQINGKYYFIFDTDPNVEKPFIQYEIYSVHEIAFSGEEAGDMMNVSDEYGSFNTGAVPIFKDGEVIGIICTDIADTFIAQSNKAARANVIWLAITMLVTMSVMLVLMTVLLRRVRKMQDRLFKMANYDVLTGLPNRQYLMEYLAEISAKTKKTKDPFALLFIDLDNFKKVNDNAGHDAGDELLRHISAYLGSVHENSREFRPAAGLLNISARIGGDEFVQIVPGIKTIDEAQELAKKVLEQFAEQALDRYVEQYHVGLSIGVALFPYHAEDYNVLIKYADIAMYHSKKNGKNNYCVYSDGLRKEE